MGYLNTIKQLFCKHQFSICDYSDTILVKDEYVPMRICKCTDCGKVFIIKVEDWYIKNKVCTHPDTKSMTLYVGIQTGKIKVKMCTSCKKILNDTSKK